MPVTIFYDKQYYDASIYKASPVPMALLPETAYDVEQGGSPQGTITVDAPSPTRAGWVADGTLTTGDSKPEQKAALGTATEPKGSDEPPRLHRGGDSSGGAKPPATTTTTSTATTSSPTATPQTTSTTGSSSPAPGSAAASSTAPSAQASPSATKADEQPATPDDPNRPRLQRGRPIETPKSVAAPSPAAPRAKPPSAGQPDLVAVSDVEASDPHIYTLQWPKTDLDRLSKAATEQAQSELAKYIKQHFPAAAVSAPPAARTAASRNRTTSQASKAAPVLPALQGVDIHWFDLDFDNDPEIVLTASVPVSGSDGTQHTVFVTHVTREEGGRDYHPLLTYVTDDTRLDEFPRLHLIDAVDADGDGIAELLFRASNSPEAEGQAFRLYAIGPDRLRIVFDSRGAQD